MTVQERKLMAMDNFMAGYNCSQALALAFADMLDIDQKTLLKLASPLGGGMGRLREVCGAVSSMFIVAGLIYGYDTPETGDVKLGLYSKIQAMAREFESRRGSIVCRELLHKPAGHDEPKPEARTAEYYAKRPCTAVIGDAAEILATFIENNPANG